jgi:hypothetical protein
VIKGGCPGAIFVGFYFIVTGEGLEIGFDSISISVAASASAYILGKNIVFLFLCLALNNSACSLSTLLFPGSKIGSSATFYKVLRNLVSLMMRLASSKFPMRIA